MPTTTRALLDQITDLQKSLEAFSFENLSSEEAVELKRIFTAFRERLEGKIWNQQHPFENTLPSPGVSASQAVQPPQLLQGKRIMVFEDNPLNMKLLETRLRNWGCEVIPALKVPYGLSLLRECEVDLVLMDLRMPGMDGFEATQRIRKHENANVRSVPVIAVTADYTANDGARCRDAGIDDTVLKPYTAEELSGVLLRHLGLLKKQNPTAGTTEASVGTTPGVSLDTLWEECSGDIEMLEHMVELFRANLLEFLGRVKTALDGPDYRDIRAAAHKVKAGVKLLKAAFWLEKIERIHELSRAEEGSGEIRSCYEELRMSYNEIEQGLNRGLAVIKKSMGYGS